MPKIAIGLVGVIVLLVVTFANPMAGNVLGFCPISEGPKAIGIDAVVAAIDVTCGWMIYRAFRA
jgi:hypothetical protein